MFGSNSACNAGMKIVVVRGAAVPRTITIFLPALLALLIPSTTANPTMTYTNNIGKPKHKLGHLQKIHCAKSEAVERRH